VASWRFRSTSLTKSGTSLANFRSLRAVPGRVPSRGSLASKRPFQPSGPSPETALRRPRQAARGGARVRAAGRRRGGGARPLWAAPGGGPLARRPEPQPGACSRRLRVVVPALLRGLTLARLEAEARLARRGLWADPHPTPPWNYRSGRGARAVTARSRSWVSSSEPATARTTRAGKRQRPRNSYLSLPWDRAVRCAAARRRPRESPHGDGLSATWKAWDRALGSVCGRRTRLRCSRQEGTPAAAVDSSTDRA
jgi:hypothetical protein